MTDSSVPPLTYTPPTPEPGSVDFYRAGFRKQWQDEAEAWGVTMRTAIKTNPETAGLADSLARKMGMPLVKAQDDMGFLRAVSVMQRMKDDDIRSTNPVLYRSFQGLEFARKAWDDYEGLSAGERWAKGWKSGGLTAERGRLAAKLWLSGGLEWDQATGSYKQSATDRMQRREDLARLEQIGVEQAELGPITGFVGNAAKIAGQWGDAVPRAIGFGLKTAAVTGTASLLAGPASPVATPLATVTGFGVGFTGQYLADTFASMAGNAYADMVAANYDPERALAASVGVGIVGTVLEMGGLNLATREVRSQVMRAVWKRAAAEVATDVPSGFVRGYLGEYGNILAQAGKSYAKAAGGETGTELLEEGALIIAEQLARRGGEKDMNPDGVAARLWEVASSTVQGMALLGLPAGIAGGVRGKVESYQRLQQERAQAQRDHLKAAQGINPKLLERDPEAAADFMRQALRQNDGPQEAHLDAATFRTLLDKIDTEGAKSGVLRKSTLDVLEGIVPGISKQLEDAEATGGDVSLPIADVITRIRGELPEFELAFSEVARLDPQAPDAEASQDAEKAASKADTGSEKEAAFFTRLKEIERDTAASVLQAAGARISPSQAQSFARIYSSRLKVMAQEDGIDADEAQKRYGAAFQADTTGTVVRGRMLDTPEGIAIVFGPQATVDTALHELTHAHVKTIEVMDAAGSAYGKAQLDNLLAHWKMTREQWAAMDFEQRRPLLEDIAYNAEEYFAAGEAPSPELRGVFQKLRSFIVGLYGSVRSYLVGAYAEETGGAQLRAISPELRSFFDRMLAADSAIEIEMETRAMGAARLSDADAKAVGIDSETLAEIRAKEQEAVEDAKEALTSEAVRAGRFFAAGRRNAEASVKRKLAESKARVRKQVEQDVDESPVYKALAFIRTGKVEVDGKEVSARLDTDAVASILGDDVAQLPGNMTRKGGVNPDLLARSFGFESGAAMLRAIIDAPTREAAIDAQVQQRLEAEEPLSNPKEFKRAVEEALHGKSAARLASTILRAMLGDGVKSSQQLEADAREAARLVILRTPIGRINVRSFANAELRAMRARDKAIRSGDKAAAIEATQRYLVQHYLTVEGAKAEREIERETATIAKRYEQSDDKLKAGRNLDVVKVAIAVLGKFGMVSAARHNAAVEYLSEWARLDKDGYAPYAVRIGILVEGAVPMDQMTLDRFRVITDAASGFWSEAKQSNYIRSRGKLVEKQQAQAELLDELVDTFGKDDGSLPDFRPEEMTDWSMGAIVANLTRLEAWAIKMDGGASGAWHRYVYQPLKDATVANEIEKAEQHKWAADIMARHDAIKPLAGEEIDLQPVLGRGKNAVFKNRGELIGVLQHMGTEKGRRNVILGNKLGTQPMPGATYDEQFDAAWQRWKLAMQYAVDKGWLTEGDFKLVQESWDHIGASLKDRLFTTTRDVWGFYPEAEKAIPFETPFGTLPGGYFPSKVDKTKSSVGTDKQLSALQQGAQDFRDAHASVPRGVTIKRGVDVVQPRVTDIRLLTQHIDEVLNIIHLQPALSDVAGLFRGNVRTNEQLGMLREALGQVAPFAERKIILPALERMARDSIVAPGDKGLAKVVGYLRQSASMAFLGFNPKNAALQLTGLANAVPEVGMSRLWGAFWSNWSNPSGLVTSIEERSDAMRAKWSAELQLLAQDMDRMLEPSTLNDVRRQAARAAFFLQRYAQMGVDALVWQAAHDKATAEGFSADEAVTRADSAVRITQGEKTPLDVPQFLAGGAVAQLFTQFADYPNTVLNQNLSAAEGKRFATFAWTVIVPTLATSVIGLTLAFGKLGKGERDDDEYGRALLNHFLGDQVRGAFGLLPVAGPIIGSALNELFGLTNTPGGMRNTPFAGWSMVDTIYRIGSGRGGWSDWIMGAGLALRIPLRPAANVARYEQNVAAGREVDGGALDYLRVLLTGY